MSKEYALIVAGGIGSRMKGNIPKQFIEIGKLPVLMHTLTAFYTYSSKINIILVLPQNLIKTWDKLCIKHHFSVPHMVVEGGNKRQESVKNGLAKIEGEGYVAIHDGVRPLVSLALILSGFVTAKQKGNAVASVLLKDSLRYVDSGQNKAVNRTNYRIVQTPQTFSVSQIKKAYEISKGEFTDDASVAEFAGNKIHLIEGSYDNIKITTSEDLVYAEAILKRSDIERD